VVYAAGEIRVNVEVFRGRKLENPASGLKFVEMIRLTGQVGSSGLDRLMITDNETNVVYVADTLEPRFPAVFQGLKTILESHGISLRIIPGTRDIWCRDYMPIQVAEQRFVQFQYAPDYLRGKYRRLRADGEIGPNLPWIKNCSRSEIVLDGGNVVKWTDKVIMTEKVFDENPGWARRKLSMELERLLEVDQIVLIPAEPEDVTGHSDGVARFVDGESVLVNDYRRIDRIYRAVLLRRLKEAGLAVHEIPYQPGPASTQEMPSAAGNYVNFLQARSALIMPLYGLSADHQTMEALMTAFPKHSVASLNCRDLASRGGVLNCISYAVSSPESIGLLGPGASES
jgi:agmatine deiminase